MSTMDIDNTRTNMVAQQIRTQAVTNPQVLEAFQQIPREDFVPSEYQSLAYSETEIPLDHDQFMLSPSLEGKILQTLDVQPHETVLEIGTGTGYFTALLANLAKQVHSVDLFEDFTENAAVQLRLHHVFNTTLSTGDAAQGWSDEGPFDVIVITGSMPLMSESFKKDLNVGGRLFSILGNAPAMEATLFTRLSNSDWEVKTVFETYAPQLINAIQPEKFVF